MYTLPLLFLILINNLSKINLKEKYFCLQTVVVSTGQTWAEAFVNASEDLFKIKNLFNHNSLTLMLVKLSICLLLPDNNPTQVLD